MLYFYKLFTILCIFVCAVKGAGITQNEYCPSNCLCDSYKGFNRADCTDRKLIGANLDLPKSVEILNLDYNEITILDNNCFAGLSHLRNLSIADNAVHTIYLDTFVELRNLQHLDLSNNRLEQFDERVFEKNLLLTSANLAGNKFMSLQNKPIFISHSLQNLNLKDSQIAHVYVMFFDKIPNLSKLDLSDNIMITVSNAPFVRLQKLNYINLIGNRWICDGNLERTINYFKGKQIDVEIDKCRFDMKKASNNMMFERMMMLPKEDTTTTRPSRVPIDSVWNNSNTFQSNNEEYDCSYNSFDQICNLYKTCRENFTSYMNHQQFVHNYSVKRSSLLKSPFSAANILFFIGLALGIFLGGVIASSCFLICGRFGIRSRKRQRKRVERSHSIIRDRNIQPPVTVRMRRPIGSVITARSQPPDLTRSLSSPERIRTQPQQSDFATFLSRLFDRPARHQYYRTINQNTVNLIRRISRSSLFINARSTEAANCRESRQAANHDTERLITDHEQSESIDEGFRRDETEDLCPTESTYELPPPPPRSETPPPAYTDVVAHL